MISVINVLFLFYLWGMILQKKEAVKNSLFFHYYNVTSDSESGKISSSASSFSTNLV